MEPINEILDKYTNISFKKIESLNELKIGMQIQMVERNDIPLKWKWITVTEELLIKLVENNMPPLRGTFAWKGAPLSPELEWVGEERFNPLDWIRVIDITK